MESKKILVTGGAGFIGTNLVNELAGNENVVYDERRDWHVKKRLLSSIGKAQNLLGY